MDQYDKHRYMNSHLPNYETSQNNIYPSLNKPSYYTNGHQQNNKPQNASQILPLEINYNQDIQHVQHLIPEQYSQVKQFLGINYGSYLRVDGDSGRNCFLIGFILIENLMMQQAYRDQEAFQKLLADSFMEVRKILQDPNEKISIYDRYLAWDNFIQKALQQKNMNPSKFSFRRNIAEFVSSYCRTDSVLLEAIILLGRCAMMHQMMRKNLTHKWGHIFQSLGSNEWKDDESYAEALYRLFALMFQCKIDFLSIEMTANFGNIEDPNAIYKTSMWKYKSSSSGRKIRGLLYEYDAQSPPRNAPVEENILTRNKDRDTQRIDYQNHIPSAPSTGATYNHRSMSKP